ncbi:hypothetical protein B2J93_7461 [Marssonina coronariae]|uniref:Uncharacterized protein n=1 Tax=Diplocarpon coronariae TaxID=2795749 RepID=A0A218Z7D3_9HELO|nr:hypothetical protein B2J93_7461 [Marssonina coronariae]
MASRGTGSRAQHAPHTTPPHPDDPAGSSHRETACVVWVMVASQAPPSSHDVHLRRSPHPAPPAPPSRAQHHGMNTSTQPVSPAPRSYT